MKKLLYKMWARAFTYDPDGELQEMLGGQFIGRYPGGNHHIAVSLHRLNH